MKPVLVSALALASALFLAGAAPAQPDARQACMADFQKLCPNAQPGPGGGLRECVQAHFSELSQPCQQAILAMRAQRQQQGATNSTGH
jgi:hypothetical protein